MAAVNPGRSSIGYGKPAILDCTSGGLANNRHHGQQYEQDREQLRPDHGIGVESRNPEAEYSTKTRSQDGPKPYVFSTPRMPQAIHKGPYYGKYQ